MTWNCATDTDVSNTAADCALPWGGGSFGDPTALPILITNGLSGEVSWDVTEDVLAGGATELAWIIKKQNEGQNGDAEFHSRESASALGDPNLAPRLVLVLTDPNQPPLAAGDSALAARGEPKIVEVLVNDSDPENDELGITAVGVPDSGGTAAANPDGTITYTSSPSFSGTERFTYTIADDHGATDTATVTTMVGIPTTTSPPIVKDSFVRQGANDTNEGANQMLRVKDSGNNRAVVQFALSGIDFSRLLRATLTFTVKDAGNNWGDGRAVNAHRLLSDWTEGTGFNAGGNEPGSGPGVTWNCATDEDVSNSSPDCATTWDGGTFAPPTAPGFVHTSGMSGQVTFDVTEDVILGADFGWVVRKADEGQSGRVEYHSRESASALNDPGLAPALNLEFVEEPTESDQVPPTVVALVSPVPNAEGWNRTDVTVTFNCFDGESGIAACPDPVTVSSEGANQTISGTALDQAGNSSTTSVTINLDRTAPSLVIGSLANGEVVNDEVLSVSGDVGEALSGLTSVLCNGSAASVALPNFSCDVPLAVGKNAVLVQASDRAGNTTGAAVSVGRVLGPSVRITSPANLSALSESSIAVSGTIDDPDASVVVNGLAASVSGSSFTVDGVPLREGVNLISATATDGFGSVGADAVSVVVDRTRPVVGVSFPPDGLTTAQASIAVVGTVNDVGSMIGAGENLTVRVNGIETAVANRGFLLSGLALSEGSNAISIVAEDEAGNAATAVVTVNRLLPNGQPAISATSGNAQTAPILTELAEPLRVKLADALGSPLADRRVIFKIVRNNGSLRAASAGALRSAVVLTNAEGDTEVFWTLGGRAGSGSDLVEASVVGVSGKVVLVASATPIAPEKISVDIGNNQVGAPGQRLPHPMVAIVTDVGHNRLQGVPVTFTVKEGLGSFERASAVTVNTDREGRAVAVLALGPEAGADNHVVEADFEGNAGLPATFVASARVSGNPVDTAIVGIVLDNTDVPVPGVTLSLAGTALSAVSDEQGHFRIAQAPIGPVLLHVDGGTANRPGTWPELEFEMVTVAGIDNSIGRPIYLLPLTETNTISVSETQGGTLVMADVPGFALTIEPGSATFPGGSKSGTVSVTAVHADKVPMVPNFGQQPRLIVTVQPPGILFDPPARVTLPNLDGLAPGEVTELYSFDHDLGQFTTIGTASVSTDGAFIRSDPGFGVVKSGWMCGGNPQRNGSCQNTVVTIDPPRLTIQKGDTATLVATGSPPELGFPAYSWFSADSGVASLEFPPGSGSQTSPNTIEVTGRELGETTAIVVYKTESEKTAVAQAEVAVVAVEIEVNDTPAENDDLVRLDSTASARARLIGRPSRDITVALSNPDGRLRFNEGDTTASLSLPRNGDWVAFAISGASGSAARNDALIVARCDSSICAQEDATVFYFDRASMTVRADGSYSLVSGAYTATGNDAVQFEAQATLMPAGIECNVEQITNLRIGIAQNALGTETVSFDNPTVSWVPGVPAGFEFSAPARIRETTTVVTFANDSEDSVQPIYDQPGRSGTIDPDSLKPPIGCPAGGVATSHDTPQILSQPSVTVPATTPSGAKVADVTYFLASAAFDLSFRTWVVLFDLETKEVVPLRQTSWVLAIQSTGGPQQAMPSGSNTAPANLPLTAPPFFNDQLSANKTLGPDGQDIVTFTR